MLGLVGQRVGSKNEDAGRKYIACREKNPRQFRTTSITDGSMRIEAKEALPDAANCRERHTHPFHGVTLVVLTRCDFKFDHFNTRQVQSLGIV